MVFVTYWQKAPQSEAENTYYQLSAGKKKIYEENESEGEDESCILPYHQGG